MLRSKFRAMLKCLTAVIVLVTITSCYGKDFSMGKITEVNDIGSYVVKCDDYLYYYKYGPDYANLYKYDTVSGDEEYVDTLTTKTGGYSGVLRMFVINGRLYYGKSTDEGYNTAIHSIDIKGSQPRFEGIVDETFDAHSDELFVDNEFKIFGVNNDIYVLAGENVYKLNETYSELIIRGVSGVCVDGEKIYYSLCVDNINSGGIMCYNIGDGTNTEIVSDTAIREYNKTTIYGDGCTVQNIFSDEKSLYFLGASEAAEILRYDFGGNEVRGLTHRAYPRLFRMQDDKLYYIDIKQELSCVNTDGTDAKKLIENERVFAFNVSGNSIYYYRMVGDSGYPAGLIEMNLETGEKCIISRFQ